VLAPLFAQQHRQPVRPARWGLIDVQHPSEGARSPRRTAAMSDKPSPSGINVALARSFGQWDGLTGSVETSFCDGPFQHQSAFVASPLSTLLLKHVSF